MLSEMPDDADRHIYPLSRRNHQWGLPYFVCFLCSTLILITPHDRDFKHWGEGLPGQSASSSRVERKCEMPTGARGSTGLLKR